MGSMNPIVVVDVSSDEEYDPGLDGYQWLTDVLEAVGGNSDSFDEVEVVSEVTADSKTKHQKSKSSNPTVDDEEKDEDDDDCVVLDGDPDKTTATATAAVDEDDKSFESDEVLVVGQKGEIACRDFPHPRYSCAKYPFSSTSHEKYCDMCHCYVCDTRAPCSYWCVGVSSIDHCHANDKEYLWKSQREYFRTGKMPSLPPSKPPESRAPSSVPQMHSRAPTRSILRLSANSLPRNQVGVRACSSSTRIAGFPNTRSSFRIGQSRAVLQNQGLQRHSMSLLSGVRNNVIQKNRGLYAGHLRPRVISSGAIPETPQASGDAFLSNLPGYVPLNDNSNLSSYLNTPQGLQTYSHSSPLLAAAADGWRDVSSPISLEMYTQLGNQPSSVPEYFPLVPTSRSHGFSRHPGENLTDSGSGTHQSQTDAAGLFAHPAEIPPDTVTGSDPKVSQEPETGNNNLVRSKLLSEFEEWLMDGPMGPDEAALTFDFEAFLSNN